MFCPIFCPMSCPMCCVDVLASHFRAQPPYTKCSACPMLHVLLFHHALLIPCTSVHLPHAALCTFHSPLKCFDPPVLRAQPMSFLYLHAPTPMRRM